MKTSVVSSIILAAVLLSGCTSYITPGGRADFASFTHGPALPHGANPPGALSAEAQASFAAVPAAQFPAGLVFARVQAPAYYSYHTDQTGTVFGRGRYSIITTREVGEEEELSRIAALPKVAGVASLSRLLLPVELNSDRELREAAAKLKADLLVLYTFDTSFHESNRSVPLTTVTLGLTTTKKISVRVTATALVLDTRTGFIYAAFETSERRDLNASLWSERQKADAARQATEQAAFKRLVDEFEKSWGLIVDRAGQGA
jgi:hypothetical protein